MFRERHDYYRELEQALRANNVAQVIYYALQDDFQVSSRLLRVVTEVNNLSSLVFKDCTHTLSSSTDAYTGV